jgi:hypothetical protein
VVGAVWVLRGVHLVLREWWGHHAEDEVEAQCAEGGKPADVAKPEFTGLRDAACVSLQADIGRGADVSAQYAGLVCVDLPGGGMCRTVRRTEMALRDLSRP